MFDLQLAGRSVVVTGALGGIGRSTAVALAEAQAQVIAVDLDGERLDSLLEMLPGSDHRSVAADLRDLDQHRAIVQQLASTTNPWGLVHVAAVLQRRSSITDVTPEDWDLQHDINLRATFFLGRSIAELLAERDGGRIVLLGSQGWWTGGLGGSVAYAATKGGIVSLTRGLARSYAAHGVLCNCISPGFVDTPMLRQDLSSEQLASLVQQVPLGRMTSPDEIADAAVFLTSGRPSSTTGATLNISGGFLMY